MQVSDNSTAYIDSNKTTFYPLEGNELHSSTPGYSKLFIRNPFIGLGFEFAVVEADKKKRKFIPFFGAEFLINIIGGIYRQRPNVVAGGNPTDEIPFTIKSDVRFGIGGGIGADVRPNKNVGFTFGAKVKAPNFRENIKTHTRGK